MSIESMQLTLTIPAQIEPEQQSTNRAGFLLFALTWAMAGFFHQVSFIDWRWHSARGALLTTAVIWTLLKPSSWIRFAVLNLIDLAVVALAFPVQPNHIFLA